MNASKLALALRMAAEALEEGDVVLETPRAPVRPKPKAPRLPPEPTAPVSDEARAKARASMSRQGFVPRPT